MFPSLVLDFHLSCLHLHLINFANQFPLGELRCRVYDSRSNQVKFDCVPIKDRNNYEKNTGEFCFQQILFIIMFDRLLACGLKVTSSSINFLEPRAGFGSKNFLITTRVHSITRIGLIYQAVPLFITLKISRITFSSQ